MADNYPNHHRTIAALFKLSRRRMPHDNLPYNARYGGRNKLAEVFFLLGYTEGAEIGTKKGEYAQILCAANPSLHLSCIDPWDAAQPYGGYQYTHNRYMNKAIRTLAPYNVSIIRKTSMDALADFKDESLDFVYIDANHTFDYCCPDIIFWSKKVKSGGIVAGHDYFHHIRGGVVRAVDAYTASHHIDPWYVTQEVYPSYFWVKP